MNGYIVGQLIETITLVLLGLCFLGIIVGSFYDVWMTRQQKAIGVQTKRLQRKRPHVTILIYARNNASVIAACLTSILKNRYRQHDIVVVNNKSTDDTKLQLMQFRQTHSQAHLHVINKRKESTVYGALQQAYGKSRQGDIILTIMPGAVLSETFLKDSVAHFMAIGASRHNAALLFNECLPTPSNLTALLQYFLQTSRQFMRKVASFLRVGRISPSSHVSYTAMYERSVFILNVHQIVGDIYTIAN